MKKKAGGLTYRSTGVDVAAGNRAVRRIASIAATASRPEVLGGIGGFGGLFRMPRGSVKNPVLVAATDGVGTKLKIAFALDRHDTIGIDLVAMSVNDILAQGAEPLFFLDYLACGRLEPGRVAEIVGGVAAGCRESGCALLGGETAEMPGFYGKGEYDLAGFAVGVVEKKKIIDGKGIAAGDVLIGLPSSGLHSNGYSLARAVTMKGGKRGLRKKPAGWDVTVGAALLEPTRIYARSLRPLLGNSLVKGVVHLTGGGWRDNIIRVLPPGCKAEIARGSWEVPEIFHYLQAEGKITRAEMYRTFNMGIGLILLASPQKAESVSAVLRRRKQKHYFIGKVVEGRRGVRFA